MFTIDNIIYQIGTNGPAALFFVSLFVLYTKTKYTTVFVIGSFVNVLVNYLLKGIFAQPRPGDTTMEIEKMYRGIRNFNRFGMPSLVNYLLKGIFAQPRPGDTTMEIEKMYRGIRNFNRFGMPSGHTQLAVFSLVFIHLATRDIRLTTGYLAITLLVIYQRVHYGYHYIGQTVIGALFGCLFAWLFFRYGEKVHKGTVGFKKDDFYFGLGSG